MTHRHFCFTLNNPTLTPEALLKELDDDPRIRYAVFQEEKGENETVHYQGYVELNAALRFAAMHKLIPLCHWEERKKGTREQCREYCMKEDTRTNGPWECGNFKAGGQGTRADLEACITTAKDNWSIAQIAEEHPTTFVKFHRGLESYIFHARPDRSIANPPQVLLFFGPTGTGKTRKAFEDYSSSIYRKNPNNRWFDGYHGQETLLLDDFCGASSKMALSELLQLLDRFPINVEVKGGYAKMTARTIVVTTNLHPSVWYDYQRRESQYKALQRRFTRIMVFKGKINICLSHSVFFDEWFEGCDEDRLFFEHADAEPLTISSDDEDAFSEDLALMVDDANQAQASPDSDFWTLSNQI